MKILVIDDTEIERDAAKAQLKDHDVTAVGTYDEARSLLVGFDLKQRENMSRKEHVTARHDFEVVLTDLMMPGSADRIGRQATGELMPVGIFLLILAASKGAKYVGLVTHSDERHRHPGAVAIAHISDASGDFHQIEGARVYFGANLVSCFTKEDLSVAAPTEWGWNDPRKVDVKNWRLALERLLTG